MVRKKKEEAKENEEIKVEENEKIKVEGSGEVLKVPVEEEAVAVIEKKTVDTSAWKPKTSVGIKVKNGKITDINDILDERIRILEPEITDVLLPNLKTELLMVGQSKGKFGGGQKRIFKQTQKKTQEGNKPKFATFAVIGNEDGIIGVGYGKSRETVPAREKAIRIAKLNLIKIRRGCGSWQCGCKEPHSIPFTVEGKVGSVEFKLMPAPKGVGLCVENECQKILKLAGIKDAWSKTEGKTRTKINIFYACFGALKRLMEIKLPNVELGIVEGKNKI